MEQQKSAFAVINEDRIKRRKGKDDKSSKNNDSSNSSPKAKKRRDVKTAHKSDGFVVNVPKQPVNSISSIAENITSPRKKSNEHCKLNRPTINGSGIKKKHGKKAGGRAAKKTRDDTPSITCSQLLEKNDFVEEDIRNIAAALFENMISPLSSDQFFGDYWEKKPLLLKRNESKFYSDWLSTEEIHRALQQEKLEFSRNIDVTSYRNGERETHNIEGRAHAPLIWNFYQQGCSIRILNPQTYFENVWNFLSILQEYFGSFVGANVYLTPEGTQGFAPHWDDIEAFVLQLEGRKRWRVYKPRSPRETLPRYSSGNFNEEDMANYPPVIDTILEPGDLLYMPRGFIHQGHTFEEDVEMKKTHSLHITVSVAQTNTWGDMLEKVVKDSVARAMEDCISLRESLPIDYMRYTGSSLNNTSPSSSGRGKNKETIVDPLVANGVKAEGTSQKSFGGMYLSPAFHNRLSAAESKLSGLMKQVRPYIFIDAGSDVMSKKFIHECLPPCLTSEEKSRSIFGGGEFWSSDLEGVNCAEPIGLETSLRLLRYSAARLIKEDGIVKLYYSVDNDRIMHSVEPQYLEIDQTMVDGVMMFFQEYPKYIHVSQLPLDSDDDKVILASSLYDKGLLMTEEPLTNIGRQEITEPSDDDDDDDDDDDMDDSDHQMDDDGAEDKEDEEDGESDDSDKD